MKQTVGAVLWDLDGTIADTSDLHFEAWQETLAARQLAYSRADFERDFGRSNPELLADLLPTLDREEHVLIADDKESAYRRAMIGRVTVLPGVLEWMAAFRNAGIPQIVCSSGPMGNIAGTIAELGIADAFLALVSGVHVPRGKPAPDLFLRGAAVAGVPPEQCLVIEDSLHGVVAAARAGMRCVVVGALAQQHRELTSHFTHPDHLLDVMDLSQRPWQSVVNLWKRGDLVNPLHSIDSTAEFKTEQGTRIRTRLIQPEDADLLIKLFHHLSPDTKRRRFNIGLQNVDEKRIQETAQVLAGVDNHTTGGAILGFVTNPDEELITVARLARPENQPDSSTAEVAVVVRDDYQGQGIGTEMLRRLITLARQMKIKTLTAGVQSDNTAIFRILNKLSLPIEMRTSHGETEIEIKIEG
ncbi:MAG: HAD-IA family hydrolase [Caldilineaceae bacterium]|nr:HAD-IA family hydrolase [Caldilineaceae bacterium]